MRRNIQYPFVCVHKKNEQQVFGFLLLENSWSITVSWMTSNDQTAARNVQINHDSIDMIEHMELEEAPWNTGEIEQ